MATKVSNKVIQEIAAKGGLKAGVEILVKAGINHKTVFYIKKAGHQTLEDLERLTEEELRAIEWVGQRSFDIIRDVTRVLYDQQVVFADEFCLKKMGVRLSEIEPFLQKGLQLMENSETAKAYFKEATWDKYEVWRLVFEAVPKNYPVKSLIDAFLTAIYKHYNRLPMQQQPLPPVDATLPGVKRAENVSQVTKSEARVNSIIGHLYLFQRPFSMEEKGWMSFIAKDKTKGPTVNELVEYANKQIATGEILNMSRESYDFLKGIVIKLGDITPSNHDLVGLFTDDRWFWQTLVPWDSLIPLDIREYFKKISGDTITSFGTFMMVMSEPSDAVCRAAHEHMLREQRAYEYMALKLSSLSHINSIHELLRVIRMRRDSILKQKRLVREQTTSPALGIWHDETFQGSLPAVVSQYLANLCHPERHPNGITTFATLRSMSDGDFCLLPNYVRHSVLAAIHNALTLGGTGMLGLLKRFLVLNNEPTYSAPVAWPDLETGPDRFIPTHDFMGRPLRGYQSSLQHQEMTFSFENQILKIELETVKYFDDEAVEVSHAWHSQLLHHFGSDQSIGDSGSLVKLTELADFLMKMAPGRKVELLFCQGRKLLEMHVK